MICLLLQQAYFVGVNMSVLGCLFAWTSFGTTFANQWVSKPKGRDKTKLINNK
jgi:hypothetical protein